MSDLLDNLARLAANGELDSQFSAWPGEVAELKRLVGKEDKRPVATHFSGLLGKEIRRLKQYHQSGLLVAQTQELEKTRSHILNKCMRDSWRNAFPMLCEKAKQAYQNSRLAQWTVDAVSKVSQIATGVEIPEIIKKTAVAVVTAVPTFIGAMKDEKFKNAMKRTLEDTSRCVKDYASKVKEKLTSVYQSTVKPVFSKIKSGVSHAISSACVVVSKIPDIVAPTGRRVLSFFGF